MMLASCGIGFALVNLADDLNRSPCRIVKHRMQTPRLAIEDTEMGLLQVR